MTYNVVCVAHIDVIPFTAPSSSSVASLSLPSHGTTRVHRSFISSSSSTSSWTIIMLIIMLTVVTLILLPHHVDAYCERNVAGECNNRGTCSVTVNETLGLYSCSCSSYTTFEADGKPSKYSSDPQCLHSAKQAAPTSWAVTCSINQFCDLITMTICSIFMWKLKKLGKFGVNLHSATGVLLFADAIIRFFYYNFALFLTVLDEQPLLATFWSLIPDSFGMASFFLVATFLSDLNNISAKLGSNGKKEVSRDLGQRNRRTLKRLVIMLTSVILLQVLMVWGLRNNTIMYPIYGVYIFGTTVWIGAAVARNAYYTRKLLILKQELASQAMTTTPAGPSIRRGSTAAPVPLLTLPGEADRAKIGGNGTVASATQTGARTASINNNNHHHHANNGNNGNGINGMSMMTVMNNNTTSAATTTNGNGNTRGSPQGHAASSLFPPSLAWRQSRSHSGASSAGLIVATTSTSAANSTNVSPNGHIQLSNSIATGTSSAAVAAVTATGMPTTNTTVTELIDERRLFSSPSAATAAAAAAALLSPSHSASGHASNGSPSNAVSPSGSLPLSLAGGGVMSPPTLSSSLIVMGNGMIAGREASISTNHNSSTLIAPSLGNGDSRATTSIDSSSSLLSSNGNGNGHVTTFAERAGKRSTAPANLGSHTSASPSNPSTNNNGNNNSLPSSGSGANANSLSSMLSGNNGSTALPARPSPSPAQQRRTLPRSALRAPRTVAATGAATSAAPVVSGGGGGGIGGHDGYSGSMTVATTASVTPASTYGSVPSPLAATALSSSVPFHLPSDLLTVDNSKELSVDGTPTPSPSRHRHGFFAGNHSGSLLVTPVPIHTILNLNNNGSGAVNVNGNGHHSNSSHGHIDAYNMLNGSTGNGNGDMNMPQSSRVSGGGGATTTSGRRTGRHESASLYRLPGEYEEALPAPPAVPIDDDSISSNPLMDDMREPRSYNPVRNPLIPDNRQAHARDASAPSAPLRTSAVTSIGGAIRAHSKSIVQQMVGVTNDTVTATISPRLTRFADGTVPGAEHHTVTMTSLPGISAKDAAKEGQVVEKVVRLAKTTAFGAFVTCALLIWLLLWSSALEASSLLYGFMSVRIAASIWVWVIISVFWPSRSPTSPVQTQDGSKLFHSVGKSRSHQSAAPIGGAITGHHMTSPVRVL